MLFMGAIHVSQEEPGGRERWPPGERPEVAAGSGGGGGGWRSGGLLAAAESGGAADGVGMTERPVAVQPQSQGGLDPRATVCDQCQAILIGFL